MPIWYSPRSAWPFYEGPFEDPRNGEDMYVKWSSAQSHGGLVTEAPPKSHKPISLKKLRAKAT